MGRTPKVSVIGAGFVGATVAQRLVERSLADVVLVDIVEGLAAGKALDMMESAVLEGFETKVVGTTDEAQTAGSDILVITAGLARKPGMSRDDLLMRNAEIVSPIVKRTAPLSPQAIIVMVTNPLDVMAWLAWKCSGFPAKRVIGMAGVLDSARFRYFIAQECGVSPREVQAMVLGGHGDDMVPLVQYTTVRGRPISECVAKEVLARLIEQTRNGGAEIVALLKTGSAWYAPASSVVEMVESILKDERRLLPCSVWLEGAYGIREAFCGVPVHLGREGVAQIVQLKLTDEEAAALRRSAEHVREGIQKLVLRQD